MQITVHAAQRIQGRTKLQIKEVLSRLNSGMGVEIECPGSYKFLLFYSPRDCCTKLAVVSKNSQTLVSIWESDYLLPRGRKVTNSDRAKAYSLAKPGMLNVTIQVCYKDEVVYTVSAGEVPIGVAYFLDTTIAHVAEQLRSLVATVDEQVKEIKKGTLYNFRFSNAETGETLAFRQCISHKRVHSFLSPS
jgi:hypothetical protein